MQDVLTGATPGSAPAAGIIGGTLSCAGRLVDHIETDYLVIGAGAGASGLAFADTLVDESADAHITIVDRCPSSAATSSA